MSGGEFEVVRCSTCTLVYTNPRVSPDQISLFYPHQYYGDKSKRFRRVIEALLPTFKVQRAKTIMHYKTTGRVLDVGCGRGVFLAEMRKRGWEVVGTELSEGACGFAREELGLNVVACSDLRKCGFETESFDVVTLSHVLEHLPNPLETLLEAARILEEDGLLFLAVPNVDSFQARISGPKWALWDVPRHYYHFSPETLRRMLDLAGFSVISERHFSLEYNPFCLAQSLLNLVSGEFNFLYDLLKSSTSRFYRLPRWRLAYNWAVLVTLGPFLFLLSLGIESITSLFHRAGTFELFARKVGR
jgi:2-polyprenyl-3-methyl-5-hydroxy-6-metoxy-1,4-benzoquinol methylase